MSKTVLLTGYAGSGKDTVGQHLMEAMVKHDPVLLSFADPLRELAEFINPLLQQDGGRPLESSVRYSELRQLGVTYREAKEQWGYRDFLVALGAGVRAIDPNFWVRAMTNKVLALHNEGRSVIIPDCRYVNEWIAFAGSNTVLIDVVREGFEAPNEEEAESLRVLREATRHSRVVIHNSGTLDDLQYVTQLTAAANGLL